MPATLNRAILLPSTLTNLACPGARSPTEATLTYCDMVRTIGYLTNDVVRAVGNEAHPEPRCLAHVCARRGLRCVLGLYRPNERARGRRGGLVGERVVAGGGYLAANLPRSTFWKRASLRLVFISRKIAAYKVACGVLPPGDFQ